MHECWGYNYFINLNPNLHLPYGDLSARIPLLPSAQTGLFPLEGG